MKPDKIIEIVEKDRGQNVFHRWNYYFINIIPSTALIENKTYRILDTNGMNVYGFVVKTINEKVENVNIFGYHPNAAPISNCFHLSKKLRYTPFNKKTLKKIIASIERFDLTNKYHFNPKNRIRIGGRLKLK